MVRCQKRPLGWVFVSRMIGIICFLIIVVSANILDHYITAPLYHSGVQFLNENFWLLLVVCIILFIADIFGALPFPLNLPSPIIRAVGSVFVIAFLLQAFQWTDSVTGTNLYQMFWLISFLIVPLVFLVVLASGYLGIMHQLWWQPRPDDDRLVVPQALPATPENTESDVKSWEDIGAEFRLAMYDLLHRFRQEIRRR